MGENREGRSRESEVRSRDLDEGDRSRRRGYEEESDRSSRRRDYDDEDRKSDRRRRDYDDEGETSNRREKRVKKESKKSKKSKSKHKSKEKKKKNKKGKKEGEKVRTYEEEEGESSSSSSDEEGREELKEEVPKLKREEWMSMEGLGWDNLGTSQPNPRKTMVPTARSTPSGSRTIQWEGSSIPKEEVPLDSTASSIVDSDGGEGLENYHREPSPPPRPQFSLDDKNRLQAKIMKAKLMGSDNLAQLELEYAKMEADSQPRSGEGNVVVLPTYNIRGEYQDTGGRDKQPPSRKDKVKTHDENGERINYYGDEGDDIATLLRKEKQGQGEDQATSLARNILRDQRYSNNNDYLDEKSEQLAVSTKRSEYQKRMIAVNDYKKSQKALDRCWFCSKDGGTPAAPVVSMGHHAYLALPTRTELVPGQCLIVPGEHLLTSLDGDDATWVEIRNFMKCVMQAFADQEKGVIFIETVPDLSRCHHTVIECYPLPWDSYDDAPAYFKEGLLEAGEEWSTHRKIIDTKPRTFQRSMTSRLPYFHVWFHLDGGYGHVIEDSSKFPSSFTTEILTGMLQLDPLTHRRPTPYPAHTTPSRVANFRTATNWSKFDWTTMLD